MRVSSPPEERGTGAGLEDIIDEATRLLLGARIHGETFETAFEVQERARQRRKSS